MSEENKPESLLQTEVRRAYLFLRQNNHTVPDEVLEFILHSPEIYEKDKAEIERLKAENKNLDSQLNAESDVQYHQRRTIEWLEAKNAELHSVEFCARVLVEKLYKADEKSDDCLLCSHNKIFGFDFCFYTNQLKEALEKAEKEK